LRIVREVEHILARNRAGDVLFVGHGAVGTLLFYLPRGEAPTSARIKRRNTRHEQMFSGIHPVSDIRG
jgi:broad specificity phosphatase PhoE